MRRAAKILRIHRKTAARKLVFLAQMARDKHRRALGQLPPSAALQFDDLETSEHTKCKPLSITLAVDARTRFILGLRVSCMPAKGHLAAISREKYGVRRDERPQGIGSLLHDIKPNVFSRAEIKTDRNPLYPGAVKKVFPLASHLRVRGKRGCITGQGELKKTGFDPLFSLNHTCAMFRANVNRLIRRTWCTTKDRRRLADHLALYVEYHNRVLIA